MRRGILAELKAYAPRFVLPGRAIQIIVLFLFGHYLCGLVGWAAAQFFLPIVLYTDLLFDYMTFSGISIRQQKSMEWIKSSTVGKKLIKRALSQDLFVRASAATGGYLGVLIGAIGLEKDRLYVLLAPVVLVFLTFTVTNLVLMIAHRTGGTMSVEFFLLGLSGMIVGEILAVVTGFVLFADGSDDLITIIKCCVARALFLGIAVVTAIFLLKDTMKGYESGFFDNEGFKIVTAEKPATSGKGE